MLPFHIFVSHTISKEPTTEISTGSTGMEASKTAWTLRIEAHQVPLPVGNSYFKNIKFSEVIKSILVEVDEPSCRSSSLVEWHKTPLSQPDLDGFEIKRISPPPSSVRVHIVPDWATERYLIPKELYPLLAIPPSTSHPAESTRPAVLLALWRYINVPITMALVTFS